MIIRFCLLASLLMALAFGAGCNNHPSRPKRGEMVERLPRAEVVRPKRKELVRTIRLAATVEALKKVDLFARVPGRVKVLSDLVDIGVQVKQDQVLLELDAPELKADLQHKQALAKQARQQLDLAKEALKVALTEVDELDKEDKKFRAEAAFAQSRLERIKDLVRQRAQDPLVLQEAQKQAEAAEAAREANLARKAKREARVGAVRAEIDLAAQRIVVADAEAHKVKELVELAVLKAPFDGVITKRWVDPGADITGPTRPLLTIMQVSRVRVLMDVPQRDVPLLNDREQAPNEDGKGDRVLISMPVRNKSHPQGLFEGHITRISKSLDPVTRTMRAEVEIENPEGELAPGMFGTAEVFVEVLPNVITVPASAIVRKGEGDVEVFIVANVNGGGEERRGVLRTVKVVLGIDDGKEVEIRAGLSGDELVVARGMSVMRPDDAVLAIDAP